VPHNHPPIPPSRSQGDALSALLDTEKALSERLATATTEATRILDEARAAAAAVERELESASARELAALESAKKKALEDELSLIATKARADRARFEGVGDARIKELASRVVALVLRA
jgi:vacuolar-type H+-ATPase subunit H